jgi:hypothetical protein
MLRYKTPVMIGAAIAVLAVLAAMYIAYRSSPLEQALHCPASDQLDCIDTILQNETTRYGIDAAFKTFAQLYQDDPSFTTTCHITTHVIGEQAYTLYKKGDPITPTSEMSYCGFGFYHGFMIALLADTGDAAQARQFCSTLQPLSKGSNSVSAACLHGFGHGITDSLSGVSLRSDPAGAIASELATCKKIGQNDWEQSMCAGGVYNALDEAMGALVSDKEDVHVVDPQKTYAICEAQPYEPFRQGCFRNFNGMLAVETNDTFAPAAAQIEAISDRADAQLAMVNFTDYEARLLGDTKVPIAQTAAQCYSVPAYLQGPCIQGYVDGILEFSTPGQEYKAALAFCESSGIQSADKTACFKEIAVSVKTLYDPVMYKTACAAFPKEYSQLCQ